MSRYTYKLLPIVSTNFQMNNIFLILFLRYHGSFQSYLGKEQVGKRTSPLWVCDRLSTTLCANVATALQYTLQSTMNSTYHIKKHDQMYLHGWLTYMLHRALLLNRVIQCMHLIRKNEFLFQNYNPYFHDPA